MRRAVPIACLMMLILASAQAQPWSLRSGFGFTTLLTTSTENPIGLGVHVRGSFPINADLSFGVDLDLISFLFEGYESGELYLAPHAMAIVTLNATNPRSPYVIFGPGIYMPLLPFPFADTALSGPSLTGGVGWAARLQQVSVYFEVTPSLIIGAKSVQLATPLKVGVVM